MFWSYSYTYSKIKFFDIFCGVIATHIDVNTDPQTVSHWLKLPLSVRYPFYEILFKSHITDKIGTVRQISMTRVHQCNYF